MSTIKGDLRTWLLGDTGITDIIGQRLFSWPAPQNTAFPFATIQRITEEPQATLSTAHGFVFETWQIDAYAETDGACETLSEEIRDRMHVTSVQSLTNYTLYSSSVLSVDDNIELRDDASQGYVARKALTVYLKRSTT